LILLLFSSLFFYKRYGFHKVNETPRSARGSSENQYWEFSHAKFVRGHPELLVDIKRKVVG